MFLSKAKGFGYLIWHPLLLRHLIIRETRYKDRHQSKQRWVEWQKYDSARAAAAFRDRTIEAIIRPFNVERLQIISNMVTHIGEGLNLLDVGGGDGVLGEHLCKMGNYVASIDLPTVAVQIHRCQCLLAVVGDAERLPFTSNTFEIVLASEIVEHLWNPQSFLDEAYRVLGTDGHLIISTPEGKESLRYDSHKNYFTTERLSRLLGKKFKVVDVKRLTAVGTPTPTIIMLFRKLEASKS